MHGKAQREPVRCATSPKLTKLLASASTIGAMIKPKYLANVSLQLVLRANFSE